MARWDTARCHEVIKCRRMDGEYHSHPAKHIENSFAKSNIGLERIRNCCERITSGHTPLRHNLSRGEVFFVTVECVSPLMIDYDLTKRVRTSHYQGELRRVALAEDSVVVTIKRRIAQASPCYGLRGDTAVNQDVAVLRLEKDWNPGFVAAYLSSRIGQELADREKTEQMNPYLPVGKLGNVLIPRFALESQTEVDNLVWKRFKYLAEAEAAYSQAQQLLEAELGLNKLTFRKPVGYTAQLSDIEVARRFDPEHYFPRFRALREGLPAGISLQPLSECLFYCSRGKQPIYSKSGLPVINSKHVQPNRIIREENRLALANPDANLQIRSGDTLLNGTGRGTIGRAAPYLSDTLAVADNHVTILRSHCLDPAFLSLYLNSVAGQMQVEMHQRGTSGQLELYPFDIRRFLVWNAPAEFQREIRDLHDKAAAAAAESQRLLEQAKTRVEQLIEAATQP